MLLVSVLYAGRMTIGTHETARMLYTYFEGNMDSFRRAPKGFNRIGSGCYRTAYLEKATNTVYKIGAYSSNISESATSRKLRRKSTRSLGFDLYVPETRTYRMPSNKFRGRTYPSCVVAQEFAADSKPTFCDAQDNWMRPRPACSCKRDVCFSVALARITEFSGLEDIHAWNVLVDKSDKFWLIDMGC